VATPAGDELIVAFVSRRAVACRPEAIFTRRYLAGRGTHKVTVDD